MSGDPTRGEREKPSHLILRALGLGVKDNDEL